MTAHSIRTALIALLLVASGAALCSWFSPGTVRAEERIFEFIRSRENRNAQTVAVNDHGTRFVHIVGMTGMQDNLSMADDIGGQAKAAFANLERELKSAGLKRTDVIKMTIYVKNLDLVEGGFTLRESQIYFGNKISPLITWVGVTSLVLPQALVEIEALAVARR
jgi:enamine deaminase RidA (YjgF/YER057c/UK114 family)